VLLLRKRELGLALLLGVAVLVPVWLALGTNVPTYELLWDHVAPFRYPRVPSRLLPIAALAVAALVAFVVARRPHPAVVAAALLLLFVDLRIPAYGSAQADPGNAAYASVRGRVLELPVFAPDRHWSSVYQYYGVQTPVQRAGGYSTTAPPEAAAALARLARLNCGVGLVPADLGIRSIVVHGGLYRASPLVPPTCLPRAEASLRRQGWRQVARDGPVVRYSPP
jgi:hypothetical protein